MVTLLFPLHMVPYSGNKQTTEQVQLSWHCWANSPSGNTLSFQGMLYQPWPSFPKSVFSDGSHSWRFWYHHLNSLNPGHWIFILQKSTQFHGGLLRRIKLFVQYIYLWKYSFITPVPSCGLRPQGLLSNSSLEHWHLSALTSLNENAYIVLIFPYC